MLDSTWQTYFSLVGIVGLDVFLVAPGDQSQLSIQRSSANHSSPGELLDGGLDDLHAAGPPHVRRGEVGVGPRT